MTATASGAQVFHEEVTGAGVDGTLPPNMKAQDELRPASAIVRWWPVILCGFGFVAQYIGMSGKIDLLLERSKEQGIALARIEAKVTEHDTFIAILRDREARPK